MNDTPITHATDVQLSAAVEANLFALFRAMTDLPESEIVEGAAVSYHHAFPLNPMFNGVWKTRLSPHELDSAIEGVQAWYRARSVRLVFWWLGAQSQPATLRERLRAHGFVENIAGDPGMAADLHALNEDVRTPDGFRIVEAADEKTLEDWRDVFAAAFEVPIFAGQSWVDATLRLNVSGAPWRLYVGYLGDQPVATNIGFNGGGVASVYGVGTVAEHRGKGIGRAITLAPLLAARDAGYRYGVLFASDMGVPAYERLGFRRLVDCTIGRYLWQNT